MHIYVMEYKRRNKIRVILFGIDFKFTYYLLELKIKKNYNNNQ